MKKYIAKEIQQINKPNEWSHIKIGVFELQHYAMNPEKAPDQTCLKNLS